MDIFDFIRNFDVDKVNAGAIRLLSEIGIKVPDEKLRKRILAAGELKARGDRVIIGEKVFMAMADELRARKKPESSGAGLRIYPTSWVSSFYDTESGQIQPYDTVTLVRNMKLVDALSAEGVIPEVPGHPHDVHPSLQFLAAYYVMCCHCPVHNPPTMNQEAWVFDALREMAAVMGDTIAIAAEPISPLNFSGNSIEVALEYAGKYPEVSSDIGIDWMPIMGITAPLDWTAAWAQSVAENIGGCILFRQLGYREAYTTFRLFPANMSTGLIAFCSPEALIGTLTRARIHAYYGIHSPYTECMLTSAKEPGIQAAAEKTAHSLVAAMAGRTRLEGGGMLGIDEIFCPEQLMIDLEIKRYIEKFMAGVSAGPGDIVGLVNEGLQENTFLTAPATVEQFRTFSWLPGLFDYGSPAQWNNRPRRILADARHAAEEKIRAHSFELAREKRNELTSILRQAEEKAASM